MARLAGEQLVVRATDLAVTARGRRRLAAMHRRVERAQDDLLAPLSTARRAEFLAVLQELVEHHRLA